MRLYSCEVVTTLGWGLLCTGGVHVAAGGPSCLPGAGGGWWPSGPGPGSPGPPGPGADLLGGGYSPGLGPLPGWCPGAPGGGWWPGAPGGLCPG